MRSEPGVQDLSEPSVQSWLWDLLAKASTVDHFNSQHQQRQMQQEPPSEATTEATGLLSGTKSNNRYHQLDNTISIEESLSAYEGGEEDEDIDYLARQQIQLEMELQQLSASERRAIDQARLCKRDYVQNPALRVAFLRSTDFDPAWAAKRLVQFFQEKERLFGFERLVQPISLKDLDRQDLACLESGSLQVLPKQDNEGRIFLFYHSRWQGSGRSMVSTHGFQIPNDFLPLKG